MDRFQGMSIFVAVAEAEGFAAGARRLSMSPPAVTRAIASLEERIGARLFHRTTRNVRLTEAGARYLEDCRRILAEVEEADEAAAGAHREPRGLLSVTASVVFGRRHVTPLLLDFMARYPAISVRTQFVDRVVNLIDEGMDVAVRIAALPDSGLSAIRVGSVRQVVCASPAYLAQHGTPQTPADLTAHEVIAFQGTGSGPDWVFNDPDGEVRVRPRTRLSTNLADVALDAAVAGRGLTRVLSYMVAGHVAAGRLVIVLPEFEPAPTPIHVVHQEGRRAAARVRAFVDYAVERLRAEPGLNLR